MWNFRLFQQARCEVIFKYTNYNLLEHEWIRTGIRTLETQIDEKNKHIEARQNVTGSYKKKSVSLRVSRHLLYHQEKSSLIGMGRSSLYSFMKLSINISSSKITAEIIQCISWKRSKLVQHFGVQYWRSFFTIFTYTGQKILSCF